MCTVLSAPQQWLSASQVHCRPIVGMANNVPEGLTTIAAGPTIQRVSRVANTILLSSSYEKRSQYITIPDTNKITSHPGNYRRIVRMSTKKFMLSTLSLANMVVISLVGTSWLSFQQWSIQLIPLVTWVIRGTITKLHIASGREALWYVVLTHHWDSDNASVEWNLSCCQTHIRLCL